MCSIGSNKKDEGARKITKQATISNVFTDALMELRMGKLLKLN